MEEEILSPDLVDSMRCARREFDSLCDLTWPSDVVVQTGHRMSGVMDRSIVTNSNYFCFTRF